MQHVRPAGPQPIDSDRFRIVMRGMEKMDTGVPMVDSVDGIGLPRLRWPLIRSFGITSDQQYRDFDASTRRSGDKPPDGRA
ncbi:hypothetical protein RSO01_58460 [Reyranella soli]|uniref:Uncharacterized protein n=1 Tax=Reyranella soli TaxID=1230389 RepID=A0A512NIA6_9HYPH|nr:hypothetical protein RSO01_58460 [Reyranella soli]